MSHYDVAEIADVIGASVDDLGEVVVILDISAGENADGARFRQQLGVRAMPNFKHDLDAIFMRSGDEQEVTDIADADATLKLGPIAAGETQLYSTGDSPRLISVSDDMIKLGQKATLAVACETDTADAGTLIIVTTTGVVSAIMYIKPGVPLPDPLPAGGAAIRLQAKINPTKRKTLSE